MALGLASVRRARGPVNTAPNEANYSEPVGVPPPTSLAEPMASMPTLPAASVHGYEDPSQGMSVGNPAEYQATPPPPGSIGAAMSKLSNASSNAVPPTPPAPSASNDNAQPKPAGVGGGNISKLGKEREQARADLMATYDKQAQQATELGDLQAAQAAESGKIRAQAALQNESELAEANKHRQMVDDRVNQRMQEHEKDLNDIANQKVDPNRFMAQAGTMGQISAAIGIGLGELGRAFVGGENPAMKQVQSAIERDVRSQEFNIQNRRAVAEQKRGMIAEMRAQGMSEYDARMKAMASGWQIAENKAQAAAEQAKSPIIKKQAEQMATEFGQKKQEYVTKLKESAYADEQRRQASAAAAQAASEKERWHRGMEETKLRVEAAKAGLGADGKQDESAQKYANDAGAAMDINKLAGDLETQLNKTDMAGVGPLAAHTPNFILSEEGVKNQKAIATFNTKMKGFFGAARAMGAPDDKVTQVENALATASNEEETRAALQMAKQLSKDVMNRARAANPRGAANFDRNMAGSAAGQSENQRSVPGVVEE